MDVVENGKIVTEEALSRKRKKGKARICNDKETDLLIDLLEQNACPWDVFSKEYHLTDKRDKSIRDDMMQEELDIPIADEGLCQVP